MKNDGKKVMRGIPTNSDMGGGRPLKLVNYILQRTLIDPLSLHFVPQGYGGGYTYAYATCMYIYISATVPLWHDVE